ncbi:MAG: hypothetical protein MJ192_07130 [Clostridia bacterium]|nr:hypothetical protein [Clostridia bacterium]
MKKILAIALSVVMMLSLCTVLVSAGPGNGTFVTSEDDFAPVGDVNVTWDPDAASKITFDGDMSEWKDYNMIEVAPMNMVSWVGGSEDNPDAGMPANWSIKAYFVADPNGLYVGFYITDDKASTASSVDSYTAGDAFQIAIDFGYLLGHQIEEDPDMMTNNKDIFYSFPLFKEGESFQIKRQESDNDGNLYKDNEDEEFAGVDGATAKTEDGWCAEFFLSWNRLYFDADYKTFKEGELSVPVGPDKPLEIGCSLYYLSADSDDGGVAWAAGTTKGLLGENGKPDVTWTAVDDGVRLILKYVDGMSFNNAPGIVIVEAGDTGEFVTNEVATAAPTEPKTAAPTEPATEPAATEPATSADGTTADTTADDDKGCSSVIGGSIALILTAMAAAVALKKH